MEERLCSARLKKTVVETAGLGESEMAPSFPRDAGCVVYT